MRLYPFQWSGSKNALSVAGLDTIFILYHIRHVDRFLRCVCSGAGA